FQSHTKLGAYETHSGGPLHHVVSQVPTETHEWKNRPAHRYSIGDLAAKSLQNTSKGYFIQGLCKDGRFRVLTSIFNNVIRHVTKAVFHIVLNSLTLKTHLH